MTNYQLNHTGSQIDAAIVLAQNAQPKQTGKGLSTNDYTTAEKTKLAALENYDDSQIVADISALQTSVSGKVDAISGMGLSQNSFTDAEKVKLKGIAENATAVEVDRALYSGSTNPVCGFVIYNALFGKVDKITGKGLSAEDYTSDEKTKLAGIETGANKTTVDSALNNSSANPVQNKAIFEALYGLGTPVESGTDLNSLTTPGNYYSSSASISGSLLNCPLPYNGFRLNVYYTSSVARIEQELIPNVVDVQCHEVYKRSIVSGTAGAWYKFVGEAVQASGTNAASAETNASETI